MERIGHFINNKKITDNNSEVGLVFNPAVGEQIAVVEFATKTSVDQAVSSALDAFASWSKTPPVIRARILFKFKNLLEENKDRLARCITTQHGKVLSDAQGELNRGIEVVEFACGIPHLQKGDYSLNVGRDVDSYSLMQPLGVCLGITPFNFPVMVPMWMFPVSIACGNTFILKPSEKDPGPALILADLLKEAGLPSGVFSVVNGNKNTVDHLLSHNDIQAISFVGSTPVAEDIYGRASKNGKRCQALGGAKNHLVVMPDANTSEVVNALTGSAFGSAGERCMAISVAVCVGKQVANKTVDALKEASENLRIGPGLSDDLDPHLGPLITQDHKNKVTNYIATGIQEGAQLIVDGRNAKISNAGNGYFLGPTIFDFVEPSMTLYRDEIFGPILSIVRVETLEEAIKLINECEFGNGTSIFTKSGGAAREFQERIKAGMVGINIPIPVPMAFHSFGGWKRSIFGPLNVHGPDGVRFFTRMKTVTSRWPTDNIGTPEFEMPSTK